MAEEKKGSLKSVLYFAFVFFLLLIPYITGNNIEELMSDSINKDYSAKWNGYEWDGFKSLSILYFTTAILCWLAPPLIAKLGPKLSLALGGVGVSLALSTYLYPFKYGLIAAAFMTGSSTSILLIAQGSYLGLVSSKETNSRDTGLCYAIYQLAPITGGTLVSLLFSGKENIPRETRNILYPVLVGFGFIGVVCTMFLRSSKSTAKSPSPVQVLKQSFQLLTTKRMACLTITCLYTGQIYSFMSNLYPTSVGYTKVFGVNRKQYAGESGICLGIGEFSAGVLLFLTRNNKKAERLLFIGYILTLLTFSSILCQSSKQR
ncbi:UNC93-like protein MFSD11 [Tetranychus urticae]|uniref:UNC93-like protein MFSD11 n=1 Tax=Tetranychus urticae TaxID=32264 RepID=UPI00077BFFEE|nr:UNC93-like protein MFSD11 [Tetranychus urticae]